MTICFERFEYDRTMLRSDIPALVGLSDGSSVPRSRNIRQQGADRKSR